jgi:hypothetical protein
VEHEFADYADGYRYFLITDLSEWNARAGSRAFIEERCPVAPGGATATGCMIPPLPASLLPGVASTPAADSASTLPVQP